jgi:hypothetical protein
MKPLFGEAALDPFFDRVGCRIRRERVSPVSHRVGSVRVLR